MNIKINFYKVDKNFANTRLDKFIKLKISKIPQSLIEKYIRKKKILVNKKKYKSSYKLKESDFVEIYFKPIIEKKKFVNKTISLKDFEFLKKKIIFECDDYIILNKPHGIPSQGGSKVTKNIIDIFNLGKNKYYMVHRLDSETSGLMVLAKNREYAKKFSNLFKSRLIRKKYYAIINGQIKKNKGQIISKDTFKGKNIFSKTLFKVKSKSEKFTFLDIEILTGRKHQIRRQLFDLGHSIVGDYKYGDKKNNTLLCLCSYCLEFRYKGKLKKYLISMPKFMQEATQKFFYNY